jgi:hypothetical protein
MEATTVAFYTDEDFNKLASPTNPNGFDDSYGCVTAEFDGISWNVNACDCGGVNERPCQDEWTTKDGEKDFDNEADLLTWMCRFGYKPASWPQE